MTQHNTGFHPRASRSVKINRGHRLVHSMAREQGLTTLLIHVWMSSVSRPSTSQRLTPVHVVPMAIYWSLWPPHGSRLNTPYPIMPLSSWRTDLMKLAHWAALLTPFPEFWWSCPRRSPIIHHFATNPLASVSSRVFQSSGTRYWWSTHALSRRSCSCNQSLALWTHNAQPHKNNNPLPNLPFLARFTVSVLLSLSLRSSESLTFFLHYSFKSIYYFFVFITSNMEYIWKVKKWLFTIDGSLQGGGAKGG